MIPFAVALGFAVASMLGTAVASSGVLDSLPPDARAHYADASAKAAKHGWACIAVEGDASGRGFAYTMGLSSKGLPELGVWEAAHPDEACAIIEQVAHRLTTSHKTPRDGDEVLRKGNDRLVLRAIYPDEFFERCIFADVWRKDHQIENARGMQLVILSGTERMPR